jgi:hypothetical protein
MSKGDSPPTPDYTGAANATAAGNLEAARAAAAANRVNQYTPYGSLTYSHNPVSTFDDKAYQTALDNYQQSLAAYNTPSDGHYDSNYAGNENNAYAGYTPGSATTGVMPVAPDRSAFYTQNPDEGWSATTSLTPAQQGILDSTNALNQGLMDTAGRGLNYANDVLSKPGVDMSKLPQVGINPGQSYQDAMMARLRPQIDRENQQSDAQLANQGIMQGSEAYNNAKTLLGERHNDLLNNATVQGFNTGLSANQTGFQQQAYNQMQPINVINALRTGSQVQNPQFAAVPQQATTAGADLLGATQAGYNAQLGASNATNAANANTTNGLLGLAKVAAPFFL